MRIVAFTRLAWQVDATIGILDVRPTGNRPPDADQTAWSRELLKFCDPDQAIE